MKKLLFGFIVIATMPAFANKSVKCLTDARKPLPLVEYVVSSQQSARLLSDITLYKNGIATFISSNEVAQYATANEAIYFLSDTGSGFAATRLFAQPTRSGYSGKIAEFDAAGKVVRSTAVKCTVTAN